MVILDTNHISILERQGLDALRLSFRLSDISDSEVNVTVIPYEEQIHGWTSAIAATKNSSAQVTQYTRLLAQLDSYCDVNVLPYTSESAARFDELRKIYRRLSSSDLKIAAITLINDAVLLTQNTRHFRNIDGLKIEDWTN